jgi:4-amino-4-deoxy-L-arabinose transferase-like glycosyltransferase
MMEGTMPPLRGSIAWFVLLLALAHACLALGYAVVTPFQSPGVTNGRRLPDIGNPDEHAHIAYVRSLESGAFPIMRAKGGPEDDYEAHQPPLYYLLDTGWTRLLGAESTHKLPMRSLNIVFGAMTVVGVFLFAMGMTKRSDLALLAAACAAFLPMLCAVDGAVSNDPLTICLCTAALAICAWSRDAWCFKGSLTVGVIVGLAILTKSTGLLLVPTVLLCVAFSKSKSKPALMAAFLVPVLVLVVPWFWRNQLVYGHPLALNVFYERFTRDVLPAQVFSGLRPLARWLYVLSAGTALSFVGIFGYMDIHLPYLFYVPILALAIWGLAAHRGRLGSHAWLAVFVALIVASYIGYNLWQVQPQARYLFPALAPICLWVVGGKMPRNAVYLLVGLLVAANLYALATLPDQFAERVQAAQVR